MIIGIPLYVVFFWQWRLYDYLCACLSQWFRTADHELVCCFEYLKKRKSEE